MHWRLIGAGKVLAVAAAFWLVSAPAMAAEGGGGASETLMLAQVVVLVIFGRALGEVMFRLGQPSIIGQILAGVILGPTVLGSILPQAQSLLFPIGGEQAAMINGIAQLGILFLLLLAGMETDLALAYRLRKSAFTVSLTGIVIPFACGFALGMLIPDALLPDPTKRLVTALFLGTALSISSLKIVATVVREMNFMRRNVGQLIVASAVIDDTAGWVIIAITLGIATTGSVALLPLAVAVIGTAVFLTLALTIGRRVAFEVIRWTNDNLHSDLPVTTAIIGLMGVLALLTAGIGVQTVLGAFIAGLLIGQSPILTRQIDEQLRGLTTALFMPVFFGLTGLHTDLRVLLDPTTAALAFGLIAIASLGKFGGAFLGAKLNGMTRAEALALGFGMNARGSTEVIVASIGLGVGVIDQRLFSVIVTMAIVTTLIMPPTLRWALARLPMKPEEEERLKREQFEEGSFVSKLERILLVVDASANGRLAAALSGHLAGLRNMPVTVLELGAEKPHLGPDEKAEGRVRVSSEEAIAKAHEDDETRDMTIHVETRVEFSDLGKSIADEVAKGHDLLFLGIEPLAAPEGGYAVKAKTALDAFPHTAVLVSARGGLNRKPDARLRILVPVNGDPRSMRAIEIASLLAKASDATVAAIYTQPAKKEERERTSVTTDQIFERVREIGKHYDIDIETIVGTGRSRELSILTHARRGRYNLVLLGVDRSAAEDLSFGSLADTLLETSDRSLMLLAAK